MRCHNMLISVLSHVLYVPFLSTRKACSLCLPALVHPLLEASAVVVTISCLKSGLVSEGTQISFICSIKRERIRDQMVGCDRLVQGVTCCQALAAMHHHVRGAMRTLGCFPLQSSKTLVHTRDTQNRYIRTLGERPGEGFGVLHLSVC